MLKKKHKNTRIRHNALTEETLPQRKSAQQSKTPYLRSAAEVTIKAKSRNSTLKSMYDRYFSETGTKKEDTQAKTNATTNTISFFIKAIMVFIPHNISPL